MNSLTVCLLDKFYPVPTQTVLRPDDQLWAKPAEGWLLPSDDDNY